MPPASAEVNATGQVFDAFFNSAWTQFNDGEYDEANDMAKWLLSQPALGIYHQGGAHLILAHSPDCYVEHGREAVRCFTEMPTETDVQVRYKESCVAYAERVLKKAEHDYKECTENPLTEEEHDDQWRVFMNHLDEMWDAQTMLPGEGDEESVGEESMSQESIGKESIGKESIGKESMGKAFVPGEDPTGPEPIYGEFSGGEPSSDRSSDENRFEVVVSHQSQPAYLSSPRTGAGSQSQRQQSQSVPPSSPVTVVDSQRSQPGPPSSPSKASRSTARSSIEPVSESEGEE